MPRIIPEARYFSMPSVGAVVDPVAGGRNPLAGRDRGGMADQGDQLAAATGLNPQDAKARQSTLQSTAITSLPGFESETSVAPVLGGVSSGKTPSAKTRSRSAPEWSGQEGRGRFQL